MVLYKEFKLKYIYTDIKRGKRIVKRDRIQGVVPLVTAGEENYGISDYIKEHSTKGERNSITIDMFGNVFYREEEFYMDDNIINLKNTRFSRYHNLYIVSSLRYLTQIYSYSKQFRMKSLEDTYIQLPVKTLEDTEPDWEYMEEYIKQKELAYIGKLNKEFEQKKEQLIELIGEETEYINIEELPTAKFKVGDLFNITPTNYYRGLADGDIMKEGGTTPLITTTETDNGIRGYSHLEPINEGNTITASDTTTSEAVFYQKDPYIGRSHVQRWDAKYDINKEISLYIISCVRKSARGIYDYGNKFNRERMNNTEIELPINPELSDLEPDWETMEDYVNGIKHLYLHKEESKHKEKLELLFELTGWTEQGLDNIENLERL